MTSLSSISTAPATENHGAGSDPDRQTALWNSARWIIQLRWIAVLGVLAALLLANTTGWSQRLTPPVITTAALAAFNLSVWRLLRSPSFLAKNDQRVETFIALQLHIDLAAVALVARWTGGVLNPFLLFGFFPVALGAMLLPTRKAILLGCSALAVFAAMIICAQCVSVVVGPFGAQPSPLSDNEIYLTAVVIAVGMTLFGMVYFVNFVARQRRLADQSRQQHERVARSRERLARVGQLSAGVSHSIRNPLHGVLGCLDLIADEDEAKQRRELVELASGGLRRIETVTSRLLALARGTPLMLDQVELNEHVQENLGLFELRLPSRDIDLIEDYGPATDLALDPTRFHEALFNLLDNAVDALKDAPIRRIRVTTLRIKTPFSGACVEVRDTGPGIDAEAARHVFDPFVSSKPAGEGTGLGLAITREIVEEHGGVVQFSSVPGDGTSVRMLFPEQNLAQGTSEQEP